MKTDQDPTTVADENPWEFISECRRRPIIPEDATDDRVTGLPPATDGGADTGDAEPQHAPTAARHRRCGVIALASAGTVPGRAAANAHLADCVDVRYGHMTTLGGHVVAAGRGDGGLHGSDDTEHGLNEDFQDVDSGGVEDLADEIQFVDEDYEYDEPADDLDEEDDADEGDLDDEDDADADDLDDEDDDDLDDEDEADEGDLDDEDEDDDDDLDDEDEDDDDDLDDEDDDDLHGDEDGTTTPSSPTVR